jgi:hypothetical protein
LEDQYGWLSIRSEFTHGTLSTPCEALPALKAVRRRGHRYAADHAVCAMLGTPI